MDAVEPTLVELFRKLAVGKQAWPLYLHGAVGTGKTAAALCLADMAETAGYWHVESLCDQVMGSGGDVWQTVEEKNLAILDELGTRERVTDLHYSSVKRFVDCRDLQGNKPAIYISNLDPKALADVYDARITSRVLRGTWFELAGEDRRLAR